MTEQEMTELRDLLKEHGGAFLDRAGHPDLRKKLEANLDKLIDRTAMSDAPAQAAPPPPTPQQVVETMREKARKYITKLGHPGMADSLGEQVAKLVEKGIADGL